MVKTIKKEHIIFVMLVSLGVFLRFFVMSFGHNFDFDSYCIVGEIASNFRNVYAETSRYNYGPFFLVLQGLLYKIASFTPNLEASYRVLMVSLLTATDLGIMCFIAKRYDIKKSLIFFLNPVSILITGYHNQFDNMAVFLALMCIPFYNNEEKIGKKDLLFILFLSLSLIMKHLLFVFPLFLLLKKDLPLKKRLLYAVVPPAVFLISFLPFAFQSQAAMNGILHNVFLYKSFNNTPLLSIAFDAVGFPYKYSIFVFGLLMIAMAFFVRKKEIDKQLLIYLIALVAFSSAITNQYLIIPIAALIILETKALKYIYLSFATVFLMLETNGLCLQAELVEKYMPGSIANLGRYLVVYGYIILAWILFISLLYELFFRERRLLKRRA